MESKGVFFFVAQLGGLNSSGGESSCHGTLYSFWSWILQCLAPGVSETVILGESDIKKDVFFFVFFFLNKVRETSLETALQEFLGISLNLLRMVDVKRIQPSWLITKVLSESLGSMWMWGAKRSTNTQHQVHPWFNLNFKVIWLCNGQKSKLKQTYGYIWQIHHLCRCISYRKGWIFVAMFSLMVKGNPIGLVFILDCHSYHLIVNWPSW